MTFLSEPTAIKRSLPLRSRSILLRSILLLSTCPRLPPSKKIHDRGTDKMPCLSCSKMKETRRRPQGDRGHRGRHGKARTAAAPLRQLDRFIRLFAKSICRNEKAGTDLRAVRCRGSCAVSQCFQHSSQTYVCAVRLLGRKGLEEPIMFSPPDRSEIGPCLWA